MITKLDVYTPQVTTPPLPVTPDGNEATDPIQIRNIDGLGPVNATVNTTQYGSQDGTAYAGSNTGNRNIVLTIGLNPNWANQSYESLRQMVYAYFMPKNKVKLRFTSTHMATVQIEGYVESCAPNIFSNDPEILVSIICPKSEFIATASTIITGQTVALPDGDPTPVIYQGTLPTGFWLNVTKGGAATDSSGEVRVLNDTSASSDIFIVTQAITSNLSLELSTNTGSKYVHSLSASPFVETSIMGKQAAGSVWMALQQGLNNFRVATSVAGQTWSLQYYAKYGGI